MVMMMMITKSFTSGFWFDVVGGYGASILKKEDGVSIRLIDTNFIREVPLFQKKGTHILY